MKFVHFTYLPLRYFHWNSGKPFLSRPRWRSVIGLVIGIAPLKKFMIGSPLIGDQEDQGTKYMFFKKFGAGGARGMDKRTRQARRQNKPVCATTFELCAKSWACCHVHRRNLCGQPPPPACGSFSEETFRNAQGSKPMPRLIGAAALL